jgi:hypothetical protein
LKYIEFVEKWNFDYNAYIFSINVKAFSGLFKVRRGGCGKGMFRGIQLNSRFFYIKNLIFVHKYTNAFSASEKTSDLRASVSSRKVFFEVFRGRNRTGYIECVTEICHSH